MNKVAKMNSQAIELLRELRSKINCTAENDVDRCGVWISTKHPLIERIDALLATPAPIPDAAEGVETPTVVGVRISSDEFGSYIADSAMGTGAIYPGDVREPLMTVEQHQRIVSALHESANMAAIRSMRALARVVSDENK